MALRPGVFKLSAVVACALLLAASAVAAISYRNTITPHGIVIHHSAVTNTFDGRPVDLSMLDDYHRRRGFGIFYWGRVYHIGYHYVIYPDGRVEQGRPERTQGAHAVGHNSDLGVCLIGDFSSADAAAREGQSPTPTDAQMRALVELSRRLLKRYDIPLRNVQRHRDVSDNTECPGHNFPTEDFMRRLGGESPPGE